MNNEVDYSNEIFDYKRINKDCFNEEIRENGFKIAFGFSIFILGIFSIFLDTPNTVLVGISISSLLFTIIDSIHNKNNLLYTIPLSILLIFCIFPNAFFIKFFLDTKFNNTIVFISFGLSFCINGYTSFCERIRKSEYKQDNDLKYKANIISQLQNIIVIYTISNKIMDICTKNNIKDVELDKALTELNSYAHQEKILAIIKDNLVGLGIKNNTSKFTIDEFEDILIKKGDFIRYKTSSKSPAKKRKKKKSSK